MASAAATSRAERGRGAAAAQPQSGGSKGAAEPGREGRALENYEVCFTLPTNSRRYLKFTRRREMQNRAFAQVNSEKAKLYDQGLGSEADRMKPPRTCWCGHSLKGGREVEVRSVDDGQRAHYSGVQYCGSVWVCPVCGAIIRNHRAQEVAAAVENWQKEGRGLYLITATIRHHEGDDLGEMLDVLAKAWRGVVSGKAWQQVKSRYDLRGYVRTLEMTYGKHGWHPHYHFLYFADEKATFDVAEELRDAILPRWIKQVEKCGGKLPNEHGIDVRPVDAYGKVAAGYVAKVAGEDSIALELSRFDLKESDERGSITPWQLLDVDTPRARALWRVYVSATKRKRSVFFSRGLRELVGLMTEKTDDDVIAELERQGDLVALVDCRAFDSAVKDAPEKLHAALVAVEGGDYQKAAYIFGCVLSLELRLDIRTGSRVEVAVIRPG